MAGRRYVAVRRTRRGLTFQIFDDEARLRLNGEGRPLPCSRCKAPGSEIECAVSTFCSACLTALNPPVYRNLKNAFRNGKKDDGYFDWERYVCVSAEDNAVEIGKYGSGAFDCGARPVAPIPKPIPKPKAVRPSCVDCGKKGIAWTAMRCLACSRKMPRNRSRPAFTPDTQLPVEATADLDGNNIESRVEQHGVIVEFLRGKNFQ